LTRLVGITKEGEEGRAGFGGKERLGVEDLFEEEAGSLGCDSIDGGLRWKR